MPDRDLPGSGLQGLRCQPGRREESAASKERVRTVSCSPPRATTPWCPSSRVHRHADALGVDRARVAVGGERSTPPYIATGGFDPLRDEGERYEEELRQAGAEVVLHREADLVHGYLGFFALSTRFRAAALEAAEAIRSRLSEQWFSVPAHRRGTPTRRIG
jgi:hypothetical protein